MPNHIRVFSFLDGFGDSAVVLEFLVSCYLIDGDRRFSDTRFDFEFVLGFDTSINRLILHCAQL